LQRRKGKREKRKKGKFSILNKGETMELYERVHKINDIKFQQFIQNIIY
jgi:hypothetical protein